MNGSRSSHPCRFPMELKYPRKKGLENPSRVPSSVAHRNALSIIKKNMDCLNRLRQSTPRSGCSAGLATGLIKDGARYASKLDSESGNDFGYRRRSLDCGLAATDTATANWHAARRIPIRIRRGLVIPVFS